MRDDDDDRTARKKEADLTLHAKIQVCALRGSVWNINHNQKTFSLVKKLKLLM